MTGVYLVYTILKLLFFYWHLLSHQCGHHITMVHWSSNHSSRLLISIHRWQTAFTTLQSTLQMQGIFKLSTFLLWKRMLQNIIRILLYIHRLWLCRISHIIVVLEYLDLLHLCIPSIEFEFIVHIVKYSKDAVVFRSNHVNSITFISPYIILFSFFL